MALSGCKLLSLWHYRPHSIFFLAGLVDALSHHPRQLLSLPLVHIAPGQTASLTLFNPVTTWVFDEHTNESRSRNNPWLGQSLTGQATAVFNRGKAWFTRLITMTSQIHDAAREALLALISGYEAGYRKQNPENPISEELSSAFRQAIVTSFSSLNILTDKLDLMDEAFDAFPIYKSLQEYGFDLMMINFLAHDSKRLDENYLESPEWEQIESQTIDRGTELLNILLYLAEGKGNEVAPGIQDFLYEYLLVDDDLYQDEFFIYEPLIKNQQNTDAEPQELASIASKVKQE